MGFAIFTNPKKSMRIKGIIILKKEKYTHLLYIKFVWQHHCNKKTEKMQEGGVGGNSEK